MNNCVVRTVLSAVMGSGMGVMFGIFMGTMDTVGVGLGLLLAGSGCRGRCPALFGAAARRPCICATSVAASALRCMPAGARRSASRRLASTCSKPADPVAAPLLSAPRASRGAAWETTRSRRCGRPSGRWPKTQWPRASEQPGAGAGTMAMVPSRSCKAQPPHSVLSLRSQHGGAMAGAGPGFLPPLGFTAAPALPICPARSYAKGFAAMGALFAGSECLIESYRAKHDMRNSVYAGCATGAILAHSGGPKAMCIGKRGLRRMRLPSLASCRRGLAAGAACAGLAHVLTVVPGARCSAGCASFAAFSALIDRFMGERGGCRPTLPQGASPSACCGRAVLAACLSWAPNLQLQPYELALPGPAPLDCRTLRCCLRPPSSGAAHLLLLGWACCHTVFCPRCCICITGPCFKRLHSYASLHSLRATPVLPPDCPTLLLTDNSFLALLFLPILLAVTTNVAIPR